jgi:hypothetical protein
MLRFFLFAFILNGPLYGQYGDVKSSLILRVNTGLGSDWLSGPNSSSVDLFNELDVAGWTYGMGISWQYAIGKSSILDLGLHYQRRSVISKEEWSLNFPESIDPYYGFVPEEGEGSSKGAFRVVSSSHYLEIPLRWNYFLDPSREAWYFAGGLNLIYNLGSRRIRLYSEDFSRDSSPFYSSDQFRLQLQGQLAAGYRWKLSNSWLLDLGLQGQHSLSPSRNDVPNKHFHWLIVAEMGLIRKL